MARKKLLSAAYVLTLVLLVSVLWYSQDKTSEAGAFVNPNVNAWEIPALTFPNVVIDFDDMPLGPTSLEDINNAFPESTMTSFIFDPTGETDTYDFIDEGGNALAATPDGTGSLIIIPPPPPSQIFGQASSATIILNARTNEFGLELGDYSDDFIVEFFLGGQLVASILLENIGDDPTRFIQTSEPFNRIVLRPDSTDEGWVIPALYLATGIPSRPIPTLSQWALIGMAGSLGVLGIIFAVRNRKQKSLAA